MFDRLYSTSVTVCVCVCVVPAFVSPLHPVELAWARPRPPLFI